jgi:hypothetical protein
MCYRPWHIIFLFSDIYDIFVDLHLMEVCEEQEFSLEEQVTKPLLLLDTPHLSTADVRDV